MSGFFQALGGLSPAAQVVLAMTVFFLVIVITISPVAQRNVIDFAKVIVQLFVRDRKPPRKPPTKNVELVTTTYQTGVKLTEEAMEGIETQRAIATSGKVVRGHRLSLNSCRDS